VFVSHVHQDAPVAELLQERLSRSFAGEIEVYVSSTRENHAGEDWLSSIEKALRECSVLIGLCTPSSIQREWVNFELGAAWMLSKRIVPACHRGLTPDDLPMPLSSLRGITLTDARGVEALYTTLTERLGFRKVPDADFAAIAAQISDLDSRASVDDETTWAQSKVDRDRDIRGRLREALSTKRPWRTIGRVATEAAVAEDAALDILRADRTVCFSRGTNGALIVGLIERVPPPAAPRGGGPWDAIFPKG
jgi:hypothetical protein